MNFQDALTALKQGKKVARKSDDNFLQGFYFIRDKRILYRNLSCKPYAVLIDSNDLLADDWEIINA